MRNFKRKLRLRSRRRLDMGIGDLVRHNSRPHGVAIAIVASPDGYLPPARPRRHDRINQDSWRNFDL